MIYVLMSMNICVVFVFMCIFVFLHLSVLQLYFILISWHLYRKFLSAQNNNKKLKNWITIFFSILTGCCHVDKQGRIGKDWWLPWWLNKYSCHGEKMWWVDESMVAPCTWSWIWNEAARKIDVWIPFYKVWNVFLNPVFDPDRVMSPWIHLT